MGLLSTPEKVLTGIDSSGKTMTIYEWDFGTYAAIRGVTHLIQLAVFIFLGCILSPILTIGLIKKFSGKFKVGYLVVFFTSGLFLYEVYTGGIMLVVASLFCDDWVVGVLVGLHYASIVACAFMMLFGPLLKAFIVAPLGDLTETDVEVLDADEKDKLARQYLPRYFSVIFLILLFGFFGYLYSLKLTNNQNWVNEKLGLDNHVEKYY